MQAYGDLLGQPAQRTAGRTATLAPSLSVSSEVTPGGIVSLSLKGLPHERFLLLAAPETGPIQLGQFPVPVDLGPSQQALILAIEGTLDGSGRTRRKLEVPDDPVLPGNTLYWQALLFGPKGLAKTNLAETFVWERA